MHDILYAINAGSSFFMAGLIWYVQVVHYPSFLLIGSANFPEFHKAHVFRTGLVVVPVMLTELITSLILSVTPSALLVINRWGLALVILIWISTFVLQAPLHKKLNNGFTTGNALSLIRSNWIRTALWSIKALLSLFGYCYL